MTDLHTERIVRTDMLATALNYERLKGRRVVDLECRHKAVTRSLNQCVCLRCTEMFKRSVADGSEDWDAFRHMNKRDEMVWESDPARLFNEPDCK